MITMTGKSLDGAGKMFYPYFKKAENNESIINELHGNDGPLFVSNSRAKNEVANAFVDAAVELGFQYNDDFNGLEQEGVGPYQVTQVNGMRCSAAKAYLYSARERNNLTIVTGAHVSKLLIKNKTCIGVEYLKNGKAYQVTCDKEVILSAGALISPQILLLSGIGAKRDIEPFGIEHLHELPGVGENLQDHPDFVSAYYAKTSKVFGLSVKGVSRLIKESGAFLTQRHGMLTSNFAETGGFLKTSPDLARPDIQLHFVVALVRDHARKLDLRHGYSCHTCILRPKSKGVVKLQSADPLASPLIDPQFLSHPDDVEVLKKGVRMASRILEHETMQKYKDASLYEEYNLSDDDLVELIRNKTDSVYHPIGTCKMGTDDMAVVTPQLNVIGIKNLRVVDASVFPSLIGGNTNAPTIMLAERASDFIKQTYTTLY